MARARIERVRTIVKVEGFKELEENLKQLPKATGRNVMRRALEAASQPFLRQARASAIVGKTGNLQQSIRFSTRLSKRQQRLARQEAGTVAKLTAQGWRSGKSNMLEVYAGASSLPYAHMVEYGSYNQQPRPFMRTAWDSNKYGALDILKTELGNEIMKAAKRMEAKVRRQAAKARGTVK